MGKEISVKKAKELIEKGATIVDVREPEEYQEWHIPDSISAPFNKFTGFLGELEGKEPIILVCERGEASRQAAAMLDAYGGINGDKVYNLKDGLKEWN